MNQNKQAGVGISYEDGAVGREQPAPADDPRDAQLNDAASIIDGLTYEMKDLRRRNEVLEAQVSIVEVFDRALSDPGRRSLGRLTGSGIDRVWEGERWLARYRALTKKTRDAMIDSIREAAERVKAAGAMTDKAFTGDNGEAVKVPFGLKAGDEVNVRVDAEADEIVRFKWFGRESGWRAIDRNGVIIPVEEDMKRVAEAMAKELDGRNETATQADVRVMRAGAAALKERVAELRRLDAALPNVTIKKRVAKRPKRK